MAILLVVEKWRPYLLGQEFIIKTNHRSLSYLNEHKATTKLQQKALLKLMDLNSRIMYKKGISNTVAYALSRCPDYSLCVVSLSSPAWTEKVVAGYADDPQAEQLLTELSIASDSTQDFSLHEGVIRFKGKVWIGNNLLAQNHILHALHNSGLGGHSGIHATYQRVKSLFYWPKMCQTVAEFIQACQVCQQAKVEHVKLPGLLQPLLVPSQAWATVSLDFIEGLPKFGGYEVILAVINKFTKYAHFVPLAHPYTALSVAQAYFTNNYKLHGLPEVIISDRDRMFTSKLWQELFKISDTQLLMSLAYHPQTDGQTERLNQCLEAFLRCTVHSCHKQWFK